MTYEEALQSVLLYCVEECGRIDSCRGESQECCEATIIRALKKQIAQKPRIEEDMCIDHLFCPVCGAFFGDKSKRIRFLGRQPKHCDCGQAIDWSEQNGT